MNLTLQTSDLVSSLSGSSHSMAVAEENFFEIFEQIKMDGWMDPRKLTVS